jgi:8-oxo-dGTP pyrophosphatase MutT (NUDIX family)/phosphohistidine phosphatase SixA
LNEPSRVVRAAGGVVWRPGPQILVVHRPRYDDWSLPKGKLDRDEHQLAAAVREVCEETGVRAVPAVRLAPVRYLTGEPGVEKLVTYWSMRPMAAAEPEATDPEAAEPEAADEVDAVAWLDLAAVRERLTYAHDRGVVAEFAALPPLGGTVVLLRHARAGSRDAWQGPDHKRPLDAAGRLDAAHAGELLRLFAPTRVVSAPAVRCEQTVAGVGLPVDADARFDEDSEVAAALAALASFAATSPATIVCSQGRLLRPLVARLRAAAGVADGDRVETPKGTGWVVTYSTVGGPVAVDSLDLRAGAV